MRTAGVWRRSRRHRLCSGVGERMSLAAVALDDAALAQELARLGVRHLRVYRSAENVSPVAPESLIAALASHAEPRFREALIPLFISHPELASRVRKVIDGLEPLAALTLRHMYTAAVYLQRFWSRVLTMYLGDLPLLPDYFGTASFHLPEPSEAHGEAGLRALARMFERDFGGYYYCVDWMGVYVNVMSLFLEQLRLKSLHVERAG